MFRDVLSLNAGTFRNANLGCVGAAVIVLLVAGAFLGLVALVWWGR